MVVQLDQNGRWNGRRTMPTYNLKRISTQEYSEVVCSYNELQMILDADEDLIQVLGAPNLVSDSKSTLTRAGSGWQDLLKEIKKGSGRGNTIKV